MERVDGTRWSWRSASVGAVFLGNICFFIASLTLLVLSLTKQQSPPHPSQVSAAHLVLNLNGNTRISRGTLDWFHSDVEGAFLGPSFEYSAQKLKVKEDGLYCIYAQINVEFRGNYSKTAMNATLNIHHSVHHSHKSSAVLTIALHLPNHGNKSYTNSISQIYRLSSNDMLYGTLKGTTEADNDWALNITAWFLPNYLRKGSFRQDSWCMSTLLCACFIFSYGSFSIISQMKNYTCLELLNILLGNCTKIKCVYNRFHTNNYSQSL